MSEGRGAGRPFAAIDWLRDDGRHGGGVRYAAADTPVFNRASVNVSSVHYDDQPDRRLGSATALSTIIHPAHPLAPSVHMHISWTEMRDGTGYWRMMADLNPAIPNSAHTASFSSMLRAAAPALYDDASAQGDRYFYIPALERHRGVSHFYLEGYSSGDFDADTAQARALGEAVIDHYVDIVASTLAAAAEPTEEQRAAQLAYHSVYLLQVLTLDRGTTSGLLVHDQNDVGILGSLPARVDPALLASWQPRMTPPQDALLGAIVAALPERAPAEVDDRCRQALAQVVREHYLAHPEALDLQAAGDIVPPTVENHS
ncbi:MAG: coproporphyrinogen III oxidase [Haliangiales bacterium]